jgi:5-bromo-4-chloroindolyl phosphate hydrolysis protein
MTDRTENEHVAMKNVLTVIGVIITVVVLAISISLNAIQANAIEQMEQTRAVVRDHEVRIRQNSENLTELRYIRRQLTRIEEQLKELRAERNKD